MPGRDVSRQAKAGQEKTPCLAETKQTAIGQILGRSSCSDDQRHTRNQQTFWNVHMHIAEIHTLELVGE